MTAMKRCFPVCAISVACLGITLSGQTQKPTFEVASIKKLGQMATGHRMPDSGPCDRKEFEEVEKAGDKLSPTGRTLLGFSCGPLANLAEVASRLAELPVFDRTGLPGRWGGTLYFASPPTVDMGPLGIRPTTATPNPNLPSFQSALQEQFGLKLETTRGPVDVIVVDSVRQPTEN